MINYPLATSTWDEHEYEANQRVVNSGMFTMGDCVSEYEKRFADFFGTRFALMTSSGSTANLLMIAALFFTKNNKLKLKKGDEIIVPSVSWSTSYFPLQQYGLKVKFLKQFYFNLCFLFYYKLMDFSIFINLVSIQEVSFYKIQKV